MNERDIAEQAYNNGYEKGYADAKPKWIPVTERLPEVGQRILVYSESKTIEMHITTCTYMAGRYGHKQFSRHVRNVTHWMPLPPCPEPPKGE